MAEKYEWKEVNNRDKEADQSRILYYTQPKDDGSKIMIWLFSETTDLYSSLRVFLPCQADIPQAEIFIKK